MGQKISALKKIRKASKQVQRPSTPHESIDELLLPKDDYAAPSLDSVKSTQLKSFNISPEALGPIPELEAVTLPKLCTELILDIAEYLPPSGQMSLSYSCRTIRDKMNISFLEVLGDKDPKGGLSGSTLSIESRNVRYLERLDLWSMSVRDGKMPRWSASYSGYESEIIDDSSIVRTRFYPPLSPEHRRLGTTGLLWICPHRIFDYDDATMKRETDDGHLCGRTFVSAPSWSSLGSYIWYIMRMPANYIPTRNEVTEALRPLNAPICPHLRLNDASIARIYDPKCRELRIENGLNGSASAWTCPCSICCITRGPMTVVCSYCRTNLMFSIRFDYRGQLTFSLYVRRSTLSVRSCSDRDWIAQVARPTDLEDYKRAWAATDAECSRRLGSRYWWEAEG